jgi:hypothetical protein
MGAWGALIMSFFGSVFASLTMHWQWHVSGPKLALPFILSAIVALIAAHTIRAPGTGVQPSPKGEKAIMWSSIGEGAGLFLVTNIVINLHYPQLLLPAMALVVGLHFLPIAYAEAFRPFYVLGFALIAAAIIGFALAAPMGGELAGLMAAASLWTASIIAIRRDWRAKKIGQELGEA